MDWKTIAFIAVLAVACTSIVSASFVLLRSWK